MDHAHCHICTTNQMWSRPHAFPSHTPSHSRCCRSAIIATKTPMFSVHSNKKSIILFNQITFTTTIKIFDPPNLFRVGVTQNSETDQDFFDFSLSFCGLHLEWKFPFDANVRTNLTNSPPPHSWGLPHRRPDPRPPQP